MRVLEAGCGTGMFGLSLAVLGCAVEAFDYKRCAPLCLCTGNQSETAESERVQALREMARVARPGGWVVVIVQHTGHPFRNLWRWLGWVCQSAGND